MCCFNFLISSDDFYSCSGLRKIDIAFKEYLLNKSFFLYIKYNKVRYSQIYVFPETIEIARFLECFFVECFFLYSQKKKYFEVHKTLKVLFSCRRNYIQRQIKKNHYIKKFLVEANSILTHCGINLDNELSIAQAFYNKKNDFAIIKALKVYSAWALFSDDGQKKYCNSILFSLPRKVNSIKLIKTVKIKNYRNTLSVKSNSIRKGFDLATHYLSQFTAITEVNHCLYCHTRNKDSCSKGLTNRKTNKIIINLLSNKLSGCPLEQKISEMNLLKQEGVIIGALAIAMIDNPMIAVTGHRICNHCIKSCIYQQQDAVNIPLIESKIFHEIISLPYGFEIYSLLMKWNPLKSYRYLSQNALNRNVLVVGQGPAGFAMVYYLLCSGCKVGAIDGVKIEPLSYELTGVKPNGMRSKFRLIKNIAIIDEKLSIREVYGFGGVSEYGITIRWNKNYLIIVRLILERHVNFRLYGSTRFFTTITLRRAQLFGFHHVALATGAGKSKIPKINNIFDCGIKTAVDFLLSLQLQVPYKTNMYVTLHIRMPVIVIGGGLTSVDAATEALAYYPILVEKFLCRGLKLGSAFFYNLSSKEKDIAIEYLTHAKYLREYPTQKMELLKKYGGVTIVYRKRMVESSAYRLNHKELSNALSEGVRFREQTLVLSIISNQYKNVVFINTSKGKILAYTMFIATGSISHNKWKMAYAEDLNDIKFVRMISKSSNKNNFFVYKGVNFSISIHGDQHPYYNGSIVQALASIKNSHQYVIQQITKYYRICACLGILFQCLNYVLISRVFKIARLTNELLEVVIKAPFASQAFQPGQFYRLQNFSYHSQLHNGLRQVIEPLAVTGYEVNQEQHTISLLICKAGNSSKFCHNFAIGEQVSLMGPTGNPIAIPYNTKVLLIGAGIRNILLFSISQVLKKSNCEVLYFATYGKNQDILKRSKMESIIDTIVWCCKEKHMVPQRKQDRSFHGSILAALKGCQDLRKWDCIMIIGSYCIMHDLSYLLHYKQHFLFKKNVKIISVINSSMQCMMKEICGRCLQKHINAVSKQTSFSYSCFKQDQGMSVVDFQNLGCRLQQNSLIEKTYIY